MNFLKNSIFSRRSGEEVQEQMPENENQMLAVWGSPGSGKTTVAVKLAARLAMQKRDVALLLCDMNTPMLPCICPPGELEEEHSWAVSLQQRMYPNHWYGTIVLRTNGSVI